MKLSIQKPKKVLKALLKQAPLRSEIDVFKTELTTLLAHIDTQESEEFHKNLVIEFLKKVFYQNDYFINTKGRQDLVIHNGSDNKSSVGVIIEAKKLTNKTDWFTPDQPNAKALQELLLYYLRERIEADNIDLKYIVATNIYEWYIIEASHFERLFFQNKALVRQYEEWRDGKKVSKNTDLFYNEIAKPFIDSLNEEMPCAYFDLRDYKEILESSNNDKELSALYKILSPAYLLKVAEATDSNALNPQFYKELLHIIGLEEEKVEGKLIIRRKEKNRNAGTLLEQTLVALGTEGLHKVSNLESYGASKEEKIFNVALELCLTWVNRLLFLKLLEGQLVNYQQGDKSYFFLNTTFISDFDELFKLFHQVLAVPIAERAENLQNKYEKIPYLNSSLFEISELEDQTIKINAISSSELVEISDGTILREEKKKTEKLPILSYFFKFLNAYDFGTEGNIDIREDNKPIINASVLGKVFEKINGYKEGSVFTPAFITMYMCRQTVRLAVVQKFNQVKGWNCQNFEELSDKIEDRKEANQIINQIKICDPAVGSGHFLVSVLNEIIAIKSELQILEDEDGKRLKNIEIHVVDDELLITDEDGEPFVYHYHLKESQRIQKTLFHEKQKLIENCLFGVDINPNSVKICRLRLWIELLKNAYYKSVPPTLIKSETLSKIKKFASSQDLQLETLPNIDINIKCGNSLVSRHELNTDLSRILKSAKYSIEQYRGFVRSYRHEKQRDSKRNLEKIIAEIKSSFKTEIAKYSDPRIVRLQRITAELVLRASDDLFNKGIDKKEGNGEGNGLERDKIKQLEEEKERLTRELEETKNNIIYRNAFEWRFEFPEVLKDNGDFEGFDAIISNPPYIQHRELAYMSSYLKESYQVYAGTADLSTYFFEKSIALAQAQGIVSVINSNKFFNAEYGKKLREFLAGYTFHDIIDLEQVRTFKAALVSSAILIIRKGVAQEKFRYHRFFKDKVDDLQNLGLLIENLATYLPQDALKASAWLFHSFDTSQLINKIKSKGKAISEITDISIYRGITTGFDEAFVISEDEKKELLAQEPKIANIIKPLLRGKDIYKYALQFNHLHLLFIPWHFPLKNTKRNELVTEKAEIEFQKNYPVLFAHLSKFKKKLSDRNKEETGIRYEWYTLQRYANTYYADFDKNKIVWGLISGHWNFAYDNQKHFLTSASYFLVSKTIPLKFILALFNSKLFNYYFIRVGEYTAGGAYVLKKTSVEKFVIPTADTKTQKAIIKIVDSILTKKEKGENTQTEETQIDQLVYQLYDLTLEEIELVEQEVGGS